MIHLNTTFGRGKMRHDMRPNKNIIIDKIILYEYPESYQPDSPYLLTYK